MLKQINKDFYEISERLKQICNNYIVFFDTVKKEYCVFSSLGNGKKNFEFCVGKKLDSRTIKKCVLTSSKNAKKILKEIDESNLKIENDNFNKALEYSKDNLKVYLNYANKKNCDVDFANINTFKWI